MGAGGGGRWWAGQEGVARRPSPASLNSFSRRMK